MQSRSCDYMVRPVRTKVNWIVEGKKLVDQWIDEFITCETTPAIGDELRLALFPGRRIRPAIYIRLAGSKNSIVRARGLSLEFLHTAAIIIDDFVDADDGRRGVANSIDRAGTTSLVSSHYLMALVFVRLGLSISDVSSMMRCYHTMCGGEYGDLFVTRPGSSWLQHYLRNVLKKTTPLFALAFQWGTSEGSTDISSTSARLVGRRLGMIFQISNDLFDATPEGREQRNWAHGRYPLSLTLPIAIFLDTAPNHPLARSVVANKQRLLLRRDELETLDEAVHDSGAWDEARHVLHRMADRAMESAAKIPLLEPGFGDFIGELDDLSNWSKSYE